MNFQDFLELNNPEKVNVSEDFAYLRKSYNFIVVDGVYDAVGQFVAILFHDYNNFKFYYVGTVPESDKATKYVETTLEDMVEKIEDVKASRPYKPDVAFAIEDDVFIELARLAHKKDITVNQLVAELVTTYIDDF